MPSAIHGTIIVALLLSPVIGWASEEHARDDMATGQPVPVATTDGLYLSDAS